MAGVQTRRKAQEVLAADHDDAAAHAYGNGNGNGNGSLSSPGKSGSGGEKEENIFLFYPNMIGYVRIVLAGFSLYYMPLHPRTCSGLYSLSCFLDALDGYAARYFNQSTRFGAVLDMVTDRCTTSCLLVFLSSAFPRWALIFQTLISLDLASHYMHMYATLAMGGSGESHKKVEKSRSWVLNLYYSNNKVLFLFCGCNELFFLALYLLSFSSPLISPGLLQVPKDATSGTTPHPFSSPWSAAALEMARANKMDSFWPWVIAGITFPIAFAKQVVNVVQLVKAAKWLAEGDMELRRKNRTEKKR